MMKAPLALAAVLVSSTLAFGDVTLNLGAGVLRGPDGTPIPVGSLIQLVASTTDNIFSTPAPGDFDGGSSDDVIIASFSSNDFLGFDGSVAESLVFSFSGTLNAGDQILLRWYPSLTTASAAPSGGEAFGQFRTDAVENNSDIAWIVPADGFTGNLNFLTTSGGGSQPDAAGFATMVVPIPEPSTYALILIGAAGVVGYARRRRS